MTEKSVTGSCKKVGGGCLTPLLFFIRGCNRWGGCCILCFFLIGMLGSCLDLRAESKKKIVLSREDSLQLKAFFEEESLLEFSLKTDFKVLLNDVDKKGNYHKALITYRDEQNQLVELDVKLRTRGRFRRNSQNCDFPPLKFNFPREKTKGTLFAGQDKLKFVSHCQNSVEEYEQHTLEEYLIYKLYNRISESSFRVRLARVTYIDTSSPDTITRFGFFLEDHEQMASRCNKSILNYKNVKQYDVLRHNMVILSLFQLMIGNCDWSVERLHNIDLIATDENSIPHAVPYDFDWAGIIGHEYFTPDPKIDPEAKYQRRYKGYQWSKEEFEQAFTEYRELKEELFELISGFPYLNDANKKKCLNYISEFYEIIDSKKEVRNMLMKDAPELP